MRASFNKWWLLPFGILATSALIALSIGFGPYFIGHVAVGCLGASATDYACYQQRYQNLVHDSGVKAAFDELKAEDQKDDFVRSNCHQLAHVIGRAALELYDDIPTAYAHGDDYCGAGYYHGAMEAFVATLGPEKILDETNTLCADLRERQEHSFYHRNCAHGLGHAFMGIKENELFEALQTCDALTDGWEKEHCYGGVFMENVMDKDNPSHPSKYLKVDQPSYPCTIVQARYKDQCYKRQTPYILYRRNYNFAEAFDFCTMVEDAFRAACYQGVGWDATGLSINTESTKVPITEPTSTVCMMGKDDKARSNCVLGAVRGFINTYHSDGQAKALCESFEADLRAKCLKASDEYINDFQP